MGRNSNISWTHHTHNRWIGCTKVSEGCKYCYAEEWDKNRFHQKDAKTGIVRPIHWGPGAPRHITSEHNRNEPLRWHRKALKAGIRQRVFCSSLADVFDEEAPKGEREELWKMIDKCFQLDFLVLTKRPQNILKMLPSNWGNKGYPNVWLGCTTENQETAESRIEHMKKVNAEVKFLSVEPQISEIDFTKWLVAPDGADANWKPPFDWLIFGGESGANARPFDPKWVEKPLLQAEQGDRKVKIFVKQMGTVWAKENNATDSKGGDINEWPAWLQRQEFPKEYTQEFETKTFDAKELDNIE